ncbi:GNAT family N-acetyltransferase [Kitasatospora sp. MBT63]|uniref:GNAT family N-acetyltransferase n=1 Tax=Kitasatospora sp. MBT63 TaxID=1444768 RepID=UPI00053A5640|nr:GNAT family N-acetyltransferase [Kitasatospora sp. MBT63]
MTVTVRAFRPSDAVAATAAHQAGRPHLISTPEVVRWLAARPHYHLLVAESDGLVVGSARFGELTDSVTPHQAFLNVSVVPEHRRRGAGAALLAAAEQVLRAGGTTQAHGWVDDRPGDLAFAARYGYRAGRVAYFGHLDLTAGLPPLTPPPPGVELRPADAFLADPYPLYLIDVAGSLDEPGDLRLDAQPYEEWLAEVWGRPDLDRALTTVAVADGVPAALSAVQTDGATRYWSAFTAARPEFRGRGLAKLAKLDSLHRARAAGLTAAYTSNDGTNGPMLAINAWLGYRRCAGELKHVRDLAS